MTARRTAFVVLFGVALFVLVGSALIALAVHSGPAIHDGSILTVTLGGDLPEEVPSSVFGRFLSAEKRTFGDLVDLFRQAAHDDRVEAIVARLSPSDLGWARLQELRDAMREFTDAGKILACHAEAVDTAEYYLASACGTLAMPPSGVFSVPGVAVQVEFFKGTLSRLGIEADIEHVGAYKSASEPLTREGLSAPAREQLESMLDAVYGTLTDDVAQDRDLEPVALKAILDRGLLTPGQAEKAGLVDELAYYDEVLDDVREHVGERGEEVEEADYLEHVRARRRAGRDRIAIIFASGVIAGGESEDNALVGPVLGAESLIEAMKEARESRSIKAVVLRIDSPGGSGAAADAIWRETQRLREKKPLVVSMGDVAGSGGYWIAAGADSIVSEPLTLTGSIGVVGGKLYLKPFYDWIGVSKEILKRGRNADLYADYSRFTDEQRRLVRESMLALYREFLARASEGRGKSETEIDRLGQGRVWTGEQALENGLVDELGGLAAAVARARVLAKIPDGSPTGIDIYPRPKGLLETLASLQSTLAPSPGVTGAALPLRLPERLLRERVLALMPFRLSPR